MEVKIEFDLDKLKERLCDDCKLAMDKYLKELAVAQLLKDTEVKDGKRV